MKGSLRPTSPRNVGEAVSHVPFGSTESSTLYTSYLGHWGAQGMSSPAGGDKPEEPGISISSPTTPSNALAINILKEKVSRPGTRD